MELSQMLTQAMHVGDNILKQLPHCTSELLERCKAKKVETIFDLLELEDDVRSEVLQMEDAQLHDVARFCNSYPSIDIEHEIQTRKIIAGESIELAVSMSRENDVNGFVIAPYYPKRKEEGWWLVLGNPSNNQLLAIKRLTANQSKVQLEFVVADSGKHKLKLYLMSDSYLGADQEFDVVVDVHGRR
jgi:pre-mRNA-splicing helicase BRR2